MTTEFTLEPKISNPLCIEISEYGNVTLLASEDIEQDYDLSNGVVFGGNHFGFIIIVNKYGKKPKETIYPTQCQLQGIEHNNKQIRVYEANKKMFWQFDNDGDLIQPSMFYKSWRPDIEFLSKFGYINDEEIDKVNELSYYKKEIIGKVKK